VDVVGRFNDYVRVSDEDDEKRTFHFCPDCGATVFYTGSEAPDMIALFRSAPSPTHPSRRRPVRSSSHDGIRG